MPSVVLHETGPTPQHVRDVFFRTAQQQMAQAMLKVEAAARRNAPRRTGHLQRSIRSRVWVEGNVINGEVGTDVFYGRYLEEGTGLYGPKHRRITPVKAQALRFPEPGNRAFTLAGRRRRGKAGRDARYVIVASVRGIKPMLFFQRAYEETRATWTQHLEQIAPMARKHLEAGPQPRQIGPGR